MDRVFHYAPMAVFQSLIENIKEVDGRRSFVFWASNIFGMNDPMELYHGQDMLMKAFEKLENEWHVEDRFCVSKIWDNNFTSSRRAEWERVLLEAIHKQGKTPYVISFSKNEDYLPMWINYADNAKGVCMAFADYRNTPIKESESGGIDLEIVDNLNTYPVCYGDFSGPDAPVNTIRNMYVRYLDQIYFEENTNIIFQKKLGLLAGLIRVCAPCFKIKDYQYELERRIVVQIHDNEKSKIKFRTNSKGNIVPYIEVPIPISQLDYIIIGPCSNFELTRNTIELMKSRYDLNFDVLMSNVKYRNF